MRSLYFLRGGVIFISIDDNEQAQLKLLCDEIFGNNNFVGTYLWNRTSTPPALSYKIRRKLEFVLCYQRSDIPQRTFSQGYVDGGDAPLLNSGNPVGVLSFPKGSVRFGVPDGCYSAKSSYKINLLDNVFIKNGVNENEFKAEGNFKWSQPNLDREVKEGTYFLIKTKQFSPRFQKSKKSTKVPSNIINDEVCVGTNEDAQKEMTNLGIEFNYAKPTSLIQYLIKMPFWNEKSVTILDFFAGSGTTLHATMQLNAEDGGHRKCILVTNNENNICEEVTYERNKRVIQGYTTPKGEEVEGLHNNNLRYYRTNFLSRDKSVKNMRQLVRLATDMLCIKNDVYTEAEFCGKKINPNIARYFDNGQGNRMLVIYEERAIQLLVQLMAQTEDDGIKTMVYVFSPGADPYTDDFEDIAERVKLCALPSAIYEAYKRVLPKRKPKFLDEALQEMKAQAEAEANIQQTLDFGENDNMNEEGGEA